MEKNKFTIALAGNPNVGKSTVFNNLTGLNQHTGNWTGKTVANALGRCVYKNTEFLIYDLPGTYSIMCGSYEEELARNFILFGETDAIVIVADATSLERNLNLIIQVLEIKKSAVLCINLMDEAQKKKISINCGKLSEILGIPVIGITATKKQEVFNVLDKAVSLKENAESKYKITYNDIIESAVSQVSEQIDKFDCKNISGRFIALKLLEKDQKLIKEIQNYLDIDFSDILKNQLSEAEARLKENNLSDDRFTEAVVTDIYNECEKIASETVTFDNPDYTLRDRKIDKILTSKLYGIPIMLVLLGLVFYITLQLANYPSELLAKLFAYLEKNLNKFLSFINTPHFIHKPLMDGIYKTTAWVIAVMLPPMAIFFPLFTLLEDLGYLPRVAFNLDNTFKKCGCCGKQCLSMCMGFGCNAAGVIGARIIDSPRERMIAILTNNFVPCNGRFPTLIEMQEIYSFCFFRQAVR